MLNKSQTTNNDSNGHSKQATKTTKSKKKPTSKDSSVEAKNFKIKLTPWTLDEISKIPEFNLVHRETTDDHHTTINEEDKQKRIDDLLAKLIPNETNETLIDASLFKPVSDEDSVSGVSSDDELSNMLNLEED